MSEKNQVTKRKETYRSAIKKVKSDRELYDAFSKLNRAIPQRKRTTPLEEEDLTKMYNAYAAAINTLNTKMETLSDNMSKLNLTGKKLISTRKKMQNQLDYYTKLRKTLSKDLKAVSACKKLNLEPRPNITQFYESARSEKLEYDLRKAKKYGGGNSTRYRITTPEKDGFFTVSKKGLSVSKKKDAVIDEINKKYGNKSIFNTQNKKQMAALAELLLKDEKIEDKIHDGFDEYVTRASFRSTRRDVKEELIEVVNKAKDEETISPETAKFLSDMIQEIKPGEIISLLEYMQEADRIDSTKDINNKLGVNSSSKLDKRNSAMSMVADLIGCKGLIAPASTLQVKDPETGKIISGTLMEHAEGIDRDSDKIEDMEKFNQLTPEKIQNSLSLKKDIANLQILDWLCGNPDRHFHNIFYKFDEAGNVTGVVGIDNDLSFGSKDHFLENDGISLENMSVITKETADRIMSMSKEEFKNMLFGYDLSTEEVNKSLERLDMLKEKIENDMEYYKDMPLGYVEDGRIRIMDDEQLAAASFYGDLAGGKRMGTMEGDIQGRNDKNLFASVGEVGKAANGIYLSMQVAKEGIYKNNNSVIANAVIIEKQIDAMEASERKTHNGHQPFKDMIAALKSCKEGYTFVENGLAKPKYNGGVTISEDNINIYKSVLEDALKKCNSYLETKDEKKIMKLSKSSNGYERYMLAKEARDGITQTLENLGEMLDKKDIIYDLELRYEGHKVTCNKQIDAINKKDKDRKAGLAAQAEDVKINRMEVENRQSQLGL